MNATLATGLQFVHELCTRLLESENHFIQIFSKYIRDPSLQRELLDTLNQHSKLQWETERRTNTLANDMWIYQIEIGRTQEKTLQETLNALVKQNRQLQLDHETLFKKNERLVRNLRALPDGLRDKCMEFDTQMDHTDKHNEKLCYKLERYLAEIESLENELDILQKQNDCLEQQLRNSTSQIQNVKAMFQRSKTDYELEIVDLNHRLLQREAIIKEATEAGDILLEDLDGVKRQIKSRSLDINWSKFKCRGSGLTDLLHLARICINELSKELFNQSNEMILRDKDIQNLQDTNAKLRESLKRSTGELNSISMKINDGTLVDSSQVVQEEKYRMLKAELKIMEEKSENNEAKQEAEKKDLIDRIEELNAINKELSQKDIMMEQTKTFLSSITSENLALHRQVESLNRVLSESGAGDVFKEMSRAQEQLVYFQSQYHQILNEKQAWVNENKLLRSENRNIVQQYEERFRVIQHQLKEFEGASEENKILKQKLEQEKQTVLSLQNERMRYLEGRNIIKTIFQHVKAELKRVSELEGTVADMGQEAKKLAMIAEYNKQIGDKLKTEIIERDKKILQLRSSVQELTGIQIKNTKEKMSLCCELSEVCQIKEHLNGVLSLQMRKNAALGDSKKELAQTASSQIKKYAEQQISERTAIRDLLKDIKLVMEERDQMTKQSERLLEEMSELKSAKEKLKKAFDEVQLKKDHLELRVQDMSAKIEEDKANISGMQERINSDVIKYTETVRKLEKLLIQKQAACDQLKMERDDLDNTVKYLQNNTQKLHQDLNESRKNEKELKDALNKSLIKKEALVKEKRELQYMLTVVNEEKNKLSNEVDQMNGICEKVIKECEDNLKKSLEKEETFRKQLDESKTIVLSSVNEGERLANLLCQKQDEIRQLYDETENLRKRERNLAETTRLFENQKAQFIDLTNKNIKLDSDLTELRNEYQKLMVHSDLMSRELQNLKNQCTMIMSQKADECRCLNMQIDDTVRKCSEAQEQNKLEINQLKLQLADLTQKLGDEKSAYSALSQVHKELSAKLMKSVKDVVDEKNARQEAETDLKAAAQAEVDRLKSEKMDLQQQVNILLDGLNDSKNRINTLTQEKGNAQFSLDDLQKRYSDMLKKCLILENEVRCAEHHNNCETSHATLRDQVEQLKEGFQENNDTIVSLKQDINKLVQQITTLEFQKSEVTLRLHEMQKKYETEQKVCDQLQTKHKMVLESLIKMKEDGRMDASECNCLMKIVQGNDPSVTSDVDSDLVTI
ncbi:unnamed protein product [Acanthoscelides obtectus]|nr:unnamed protein product [Acanthoscelides obtectus]CAK1675854.1 hypothetical protein AOBTE_LOCUS30447 [Acanthoscelides obtectus]